jgi:glycosyltransferase involved in cell wall biosynthesis
VQKVIVISAINIVDGGQLSILRECLAWLSAEMAGKYDIVALVHRRELADFPGIRYIEFPLSKKSWWMRLYYEFIHFRKLSARLKPHLWLSLQDVTPNVHADIRAVYCHNPSPFYRLPLKDAFLDYRFTMFNLFYKQVYRINIRDNRFVMVQQDWLRDAFRRMYGIDNIIVAHPSAEVPPRQSLQPRPAGGKTAFFYPTMPRVFKNIEVVCRAVEGLITQTSIGDFEVVITIRGDENAYARRIFKSYGRTPHLRFAGLLTRAQVHEQMAAMDCLLFPSRLETWGLPISECKAFGKPMLVADLQYAKETVGDYNKVRFFDPDAPESLSALMKQVIERTIVYDRTCAAEIPPPHARNWKELFELLLGASN